MHLKQSNLFETILVFLIRALESEIYMIASVSITSRTLFSLCIVAVLGLIGCSASDPTADSNQTQAATTPPEVSNPVIPTASSIQIDGSSTVFPISDAIAKEYSKSKGESAIPIQGYFILNSFFNKAISGKKDTHQTGVMRMSHFGKSGFRCNLFSTARISTLLSEICFS